VLRFRAGQPLLVLYDEGDVIKAGPQGLDGPERDAGVWWGRVQVISSFKIFDPCVEM